MKKKGFKLLESYRLGFFYNQHLSTGNASPLQILQIRSISKDLWVHYISCYVTLNSDTQNIIVHCILSTELIVNNTSNKHELIKERKPFAGHIL